MPNLNAANFRLGYGTAKRTLGARLQDRWIDVLSFGADPTGDTDSTDAIKAAIEFAYGTMAAPHGSTGLSNDLYTFHTGTLQFTQNRPLFFPPGDYKISSMLRVPVSYSVNLIGSGSHQTRIFWDPEAPAEPPPEEQVASVYFPEPPHARHEFVPDDISALITFYMGWGSYVEGLTFDASGVQDVACRLYHWPPHISNIGEDPTDVDPPYEFVVGDDGSQGKYIDCIFANGAVTGFLSGGAKMGSERMFKYCQFLNNGTYGHAQFFQNALNHWFYGCHFEGNALGHNSVAAGHNTFSGCTFADNSLLDIFQAYGGTLVQHCSSTSVNFACTDGHLIANRHVNGSEGNFHCSSHTPPGGGTSGTNVQRAILVGNYSSNGVVGFGTAAIHLKGNTFDNADYLDIAMSGASWVFEDGTMLKEPAP